MSDCIETTINGFNAQVRKVRDIAREFPEQELRMSLTVFNSNVDNIFSNLNPEKVELLNSSVYKTSGSTALYDAIGKTIFQIENEMKARGDRPNDTAVVIIITDGYENASRLFSLKDIRESIMRLEATGRWTFSFLGATLDAVDVAERMAFKRANSFAFEKKSMNSDVWDKVNHSMNTYILKKQMGRSLDEFYDDDMKK